jgi:glycolate oxidase FAD binding subunit
VDIQSLPESPQIASTVRVRSVDELADILRDATRDANPVIPFGGATSLHTGNATGESYLGVDLRGLSGVREYHPTDLTASFWAGTTLDEVRAVLAEHGQELPVDMVHTDTATIGGMVATGFSGPRRLGAGTLKDLIIGAGYVRADGLVAKAGGMLVKNVSGYEIPRFLHGSWGSLAVITSINLKVIPKPKADVTFVHQERSLGTALAAQLSILQHHPGVVALVTEKHAGGWDTSARIMGRQGSIDAQLASFRNDLGSQTRTEEGEQPWADYNQRWAENDGSVRLIIGGRASVLHRLALQLDEVDGVQSMAISLGTGTLRLSMHPNAPSMSDLLARFRDRAVTWVIESAPAAWRGTEGVWGPERGDQALAQSIKDEFDPANILNRGRLFI